MKFESLRCPYCGMEGQLERNGELWYCAYCGNNCTDDDTERAFARVQAALGAQLRGAIDEALLRTREEQYYNLRSLLWEKIHAKYIDSGAIVSVCRDIKKLEPHDFLASFFEVANSGTAEEVSKFIHNISVKENAMFLDTVIDFMIVSLENEYIMPVSYLIERAYKGRDLPKFEDYSTKLETEAEKVDSGIYSTMLPRDVFIAYSSKDMDKVIELMNKLESNGLTCFVAQRNLQHGRGAVANYRTALRSAIDNSKMIVFVSSKNSRSFACDALKEELGYIRESELKAAPPQYRSDYANLPSKYKKMRVEYRLDDTATPVDRFVREFFANLDYCESPEKVLDRIVEYSFYGMGEEEEETPAPTYSSPIAASAPIEENNVFCTSCGAKNRVGTKFCAECGGRSFAEKNEKYCVDCEAANSIKAKFCTSCGGKSFVFSKEELNAIISERKAKEEAERKAREEAERKAREEAERKVREEAERKAREEAERKAKEEAERKAKEEAERKAREEAERKAKEEVERKAREEAEARKRNSLEISGTMLVGYKGKDTKVSIPDGITEIRFEAFKNCKHITSVSVPDSVIKIFDRAFCGCENLTSVTIGNNVTSIAKSAFDGCNSLTRITVDKNNNAYKDIDGNLYKKDESELLRYAVGKKEKIFAIPKTVRIIGDKAFYNCESLARVIIPDGVRSIGDAAFWGCKSLEHIVIPKTVRIIWSEAFYGCESLASVIIPDGVEEIRRYAFYGCKNLTKVIIPETVFRIGAVAFQGVPLVHCRIKKPLLGHPKEWDKNWRGSDTEVVWNYKGK